MIKWTDEQLEAITKQDQNIIVSAGAGSGKTAVLTERVINKLKQGININELLILTFTNAAALEMKERIRKAVKKDDSLTKQLELLDEAYITTFDSYSLSILKKYHYLLNVSDNVSIIESTISNFLKRKYLDEIFEEYYNSKDPLFLKYLTTFTNKDDGQLKESLLNIYEKTTMIYEQDEYLEEFVSGFNNEEKINELKNIYINEIKLLVTEIKEVVELLSFEMEEKDVNKLNEYINFIHEDFDYDNFSKKIPDTNFRTPNNSSDLVKEYLTIMKDNIVELRELFTYETLNDLHDAFLFNKDYALLFKDIFIKLKTKLNNYKDVYNVYEFIDITRMSIKLVTEFEEVRNHLKDSYKEIMIDEYQDTNDLQEAFISSISNNNVYMVGDIKQSIYGFRNANMDIFKSKYDKYKLNDGGYKIDLNKNFRSRFEVIKAVNEIFNKIMTEDMGEANYEAEHQMVFGNKNYDNVKEKQNYDLEILTYSEDDYEEFNLLEKEVFIIANDIKEKIKNDYKVIDKETNTLRTVKYSDFTILMDRSVDFDIFKKIFEYEQIPLNVLRDEKLTSSDEILIIKNILKALVELSKNRYSNVLKYSYVSISRSYLYNTNDEEIFINITNDTYKESEIINKLKSILETDLSISNLLTLIYDEFDIYNKLITAGDVEKRHVALTYLIMLASNLESLSYNLEDFATYIEEAVEKEVDISYNINNETKDSVTIMTIHKSKGLEFPICYYPRFTKEYNTRDLNDNYLFSNKYGIILPVYEKGIKPSPLKSIYKKEYMMETISESIRLLYVSLTRAKEKMIIILPEKEKEVKKIRSFYDLIHNSLSDLSNYKEKVNLSTIGLTKDYGEVRRTNFENKINIKDNYKLKEFNYDKEFEDSLSFSKKINTLITKSDLSNIELGLYLHDILENINFYDIDLSNVEEQYKSKIESLVNNKIFDNIEHKNIYKEYEFSYIKDNIVYNGIIDLVVEDKDKILVIDYKLSNIDDPDYLEQLKGYKNFIENKTNKKVEIYLYSILKEELKELE